MAPVENGVLSSVADVGVIYFVQVHEMSMLSAIQEAKKDNVRNFDDYMMKLMEVNYFGYPPVSAAPEIDEIKLVFILVDLPFYLHVSDYPPPHLIQLLV